MSPPGGCETEIGETTRRRWSMWRRVLQREREGHHMEEATETECSGFWQPVDRETERVITRGQLETQELGRAGRQAGHLRLGTRRETWAGVCVPTCILCWEEPSRERMKEQQSKTGKRRKEGRSARGHTRRVYVCYLCTWHWVKGWEWHWMHQRTVRGQCSRCQQEANSSIGMRISQRAINTPG